MLRTDIDIRIATTEDAAAISRTILNALHETNARDYAPPVIERIAASFGPHHIARELAGRHFLVATLRDDVVGTVSLEKNVLRCFFVDPVYHRQGVGTALLEEIEGLAAANGYFSLAVAASVTAEHFYRRRGFTALRNVMQGSVRVILMTKELD
ncbi:GNAT family N-acetyltransferase [Dongia soli]|uniref:GNAT family N-acetyltransferase n=1 Tax=Dongia soli TaxID=600628 RepID=A0ABU5E9T8_9PROT|nr:GNAT family N-acetyltransferase [Dongia soli]MDY0882549.1 GNAT family N-acetyltransferase [Dongia soli]